MATDNARTREHLGPMVLPVSFPRLSIPEQLLVVIDSERVDRGLPPFVSLTASLDRNAQAGADKADDPPELPPSYDASDGEWAGASANALDAAYGWMYDDGPGSGNLDCPKAGAQGCWGHRHGILDDFGPHETLVMGGAVNPTGDTVQGGQEGGTSIAATLASTTGHTGAYLYTWQQALEASKAGTLKPQALRPTHASATGIPDPPRSVSPVPDYTHVCLRGLDSSPACVGAALSAIDNARAQEGVKPMVLPSDFASLPLPDQLLVAFDRERVDRGLPPFLGLTAELDRSAQAGANQATYPPNPGPTYLVADTDWVGGPSNGLDIDYAFMYDDGSGSPITDCPKTAADCWQDRHYVLDEFGASAILIMGAAVNPTADTTPGDKGGPSVAVSLASTVAQPSAYSYTWAQALAATP